MELFGLGLDVVALSCVDYIDTDVSRMRKRESIIDRQTRRALFYC